MRRESYYFSEFWACFYFRKWFYSLLLSKDINPHIPLLFYWQIPLSGCDSIIGRAVVVHGDPDDLGKGKFFIFRFLCFPTRGHTYLQNVVFIIFPTSLWHQCACQLWESCIWSTSLIAPGGHELSKSTGNAGARIACGEFHQKYFVYVS